MTLLFAPNPVPFHSHLIRIVFFSLLDTTLGDSGTVVEKSFSNQKVASSIPCRSVLEQDTEPLIAPDLQCAISVNVKCKMCIHCKSHICKSLWIKASAKVLL